MDNGTVCFGSTVAHVFFTFDDTGIYLIFGKFSCNCTADNPGTNNCYIIHLHYAYDHLEACQLLLCCAEGTRYADLVDEMVAVEIQATHNYQDVLGSLGMPSPRIDPQLEHILVTGMFRAFFELVIHAMPLPAAERYLQEMRAFYTAGWMKMMGQT